MLTTILFELLLIFLLILLNGAFAMSEIGILSARQTRLEQEAEEGVAGAKAALQLQDEPNRFLSSVQIGITLVGILAGAFGGATLAGEIADWLKPIPVIGQYAESIGVGIVVIAITYFTLVLGELVPKRIALSRTEWVAVTFSRPMRLIARITAPAVRLLSLSTGAVMSLLGLSDTEANQFSEEELHLLLEDVAQEGTLEDYERQVVDRALRLDDIPISQLMTPAPNMIWLDINDPTDEILERIARARFMLFPLCEGTRDNVLGIINVKDLWRQQLRGEETDLKALLKEPFYVPETTPALNVVRQFQEHATEMALVIDEYGGIDGLVTLTDILEALVGDIPLPGEQPAPRMQQRTDGTWLIDAALPVEKFKETLGRTELPGEKEWRTQTIGGYIVHMLGHLPEEAEVMRVGNLQFEIIDMDGKRVDKLLLTVMTNTGANGE